MLENKNYDILLNTDQDTSFNIFFETLENCIHDTNDLTDFNQATFMRFLNYQIDILNTGSLVYLPSYALLKIWNNLPLDLK